MLGVEGVGIFMFSKFIASWLDISKPISCVRRKETRKGLGTSVTKNGKLCYPK